MGLADIVPGVSGGTMALILGIYTQFIDAIKGLHLRWVPPLVRWLKDGRKQEDWQALVAEIESLNLPFLVSLGGGIAVALGIGSVIIPAMMEAYPVQMRAFFFGLIVASVWVPLKMIQPGKGPRIMGVVLAGVIGAGFGYVVTNPANSFEATRQWTKVTSQGESLEHLARRAPSALATDQIYWAPQNAPLRQAIGADNAVASNLEKLHNHQQTIEATDKKALKARAKPYNELQVPAGVVVQVSQPALWYVFVCGAVAISAMLLPGISGSYILLILGAYFFILNALKGMIKTLISGAIPTTQAPYVILFIIGVVIGILSFARVLSFLLHRFPSVTLAALVGLMLGCLRGIWPFRSVADGVIVNVMPEGMSTEVVHAAITFVVGLIIVGALTWLGNMREAKEAAVD